MQRICWCRKHILIASVFNTGAWRRSLNREIHYMSNCWLIFAQVMICFSALRAQNCVHKNIQDKKWFLVEIKLQCLIVLDVLNCINSNKSAWIRFLDGWSFRAESSALTQRICCLGCKTLIISKYFQSTRKRLKRFWE